MLTRQNIFAYVWEKYSISPDYPFPSAPFLPVLRHRDNLKLFAMVLDMPRKKIGLPGPGRVDIINVKLGDPLQVDLLLQKKGYCKGYQAKGRNWVSIVIDGTVPFQEICQWIDESFLVTASKKTKQSLLPPKEWLIPANPRFFDILHAFDFTSEIDWKHGKSIRVGDTVFMYVAAPVSAIIYQCVVTKTDIPFYYASANLSISSLMKIQLIQQYTPDQFPLERLKTDYGISTVRGPRCVPNALSAALHEETARETISK